MLRLIPQPCSVREYGGFCRKTDDIRVTAVNGMKDGEYKLKTVSGCAQIECGGKKGEFYARMTLREMKMLYGAYPRAEIHDFPAFAYRGFMIDCSRHFFPAEELKKIIDLAAMLKFNVFHWHISDDQGFRLELDSYPQLTKNGSVRDGDNFGAHCSSKKRYGGYYTKAETADIVKYCEERFITVVPEIDMPGHTSAILHVFPELSCGRQSVGVKCRQGIYKENMCLGNKDTGIFVKNLLSELCGMFPGEYFHIGGDEAPDDLRKNCPLCNAALKEKGLSSFGGLRLDFANETAAFLKQKGKKAIVWNDNLKSGNVGDNITVQRWMDPKGLAFEAANAGTPVIISDFTPYYADYPYGMHTLKAVYKKDPTGEKKLTEEGRHNITGIESPVWTEYIDSPEKLEYMCLPRWLAVAENAWSPQENKNYREFRRVCDTLCDRLRLSGFTVAPEKERRMPVYRRLAETALFFIKFTGNNGL